MLKYKFEDYPPDLEKFYPCVAGGLNTVKLTWKNLLKATTEYKFFLEFKFKKLQ